MKIKGKKKDSKQIPDAKNVSPKNLGLKIFGWKKIQSNLGPRKLRA